MTMFRWVPLILASAMVITRVARILELLRGPATGDRIVAGAAIVLIPVTVFAGMKLPMVANRLGATRELGSMRTQIAVAVLMVLAGMALFAPILAPYDPIAFVDLANARSLPPSLAHPFGTDQFSRDLLSRMIYGARVSLSIAVLAITLSITLGAALGMLAGSVGGVLDGLLMRTVDAAVAVPRLVLLIVVLALWDRADMLTIILVLGLTGWFETSRLARAEVLSLRSRGFVDAARASGVSGVAILGRHILPNIAAPLIVTATLGVGQLILVEAGLSFLGLGISPPTPSWGTIIRDGQNLLHTSPWITTIPGLAIVATVMTFSILGESVQAVLNPRANE